MSDYFWSTEPIQAEYLMLVTHRQTARGRDVCMSPRWLLEHWPGAVFDINLEAGGRWAYVGVYSSTEDAMKGRKLRWTQEVRYTVAGFEPGALEKLVADPVRLAALLLSPRPEVRQAAILATGGA